MRRILPIVTTVITTFILTSLLQPISLLQLNAQTSATCYTFRETGKIVCGRFLQYWQQHGQLPVFGFPVSHPFVEVSPVNGKSYTVQYFERAVFELHPENKPPHDVLLSPLGIMQFRSKHPNGETLAPYVEDLPRYPGARDVNVTYPVPGSNREVTMTYTARATPNEILGFYRDVMAKNGWQPAQFSREYPDSAEFVYPVYGEGQFPTVYSLGVLVTRNNQNETSVRVRLLIDGPG